MIGLEILLLILVVGVALWWLFVDEPEDPRD